jgi:alkanesulfonate monooxygenase SsuD/methylene tetrahydromethanopterin reductase-like flavin-dependent oxidoreductase (luciferase family)
MGELGMIAGVLSYAVGLPNVREYADPGLLVDLAVEAEAAGWDGVFVWDHVAREEDPSVPATDPWIAVAGMAARTQRVRLGIMVTPLARRRPWKVAREAVALDALCGGRFTLGVGLGGGAQAEFAAFGEDPDPRVRADRLDEGLAILDGLWSGEPFSFEGEHHRVSGAQFLPRAVQEPRVRSGSPGAGPTGARSGARRAGTASSRSSRASSRGRCRCPSCWPRPCATRASTAPTTPPARSTLRSSASARGRTAGPMRRSPRTTRAPA